MMELLGFVVFVAVVYSIYKYFAKQKHPRVDPGKPDGVAPNEGSSQK